MSLNAHCGLIQNLRNLGEHISTSLPFKSGRAGEQQQQQQSSTSEVVRGRRE